MKRNASALAFRSAVETHRASFDQNDPARRQPLVRRFKLIEGRNQQIRIMFKHFGRLVEKLRRVRIGNVELGPLEKGGFRYLTPEEVTKLMRLAATDERASDENKRPAMLLETLRRSPWSASRVTGGAPAMAFPNTRCSPPVIALVPVNPKETGSAGREVVRHARRSPTSRSTSSISSDVQVVPGPRRCRHPHPCEVRLDAGRRHSRRGGGEGSRSWPRSSSMDRCILKEHRKMLVAHSSQHLPEPSFPRAKILRRQIVRRIHYRHFNRCASPAQQSRQTFTRTLRHLSRPSAPKAPARAPRPSNPAAARTPQSSSDATNAPASTPGCSSSIDAAILAPLENPSAKTLDASSLYSTTAAPATPASSAVRVRTSASSKTSRRYPRAKKRAIPASTALPRGLKNAAPGASARANQQQIVFIATLPMQHQNC